MRAPDPQHHQEAWATRLTSPAVRAKEAVKTLLSGLDHPDLRAALEGCSLRDGRQLDPYLFSPTDDAPPPVGRRMLLDFIDGKPVDSLDMKNLLQAIHQACVTYTKKFVDLPDDALLQPSAPHDYYDLRTPSDGTSPYYVLHYSQRKDAEDAGQKFLSPEQREALGHSVGEAKQLARIVLGNLQSPSR